MDYTAHARDLSALLPDGARGWNNNFATGPPDSYGSLKKPDSYGERRRPLAVPVELKTVVRVGK